MWIAVPANLSFISGEPIFASLAGWVHSVKGASDVPSLPGVWKYCNRAVRQPQGDRHQAVGVPCVLVSPSCSRSLKIRPSDSHRVIVTRLWACRVC